MANFTDNHQENIDSYRDHDSRTALLNSVFDEIKNGNFHHTIFSQTSHSNPTRDRILGHLALVEPGRDDGNAGKPSSTAANEIIQPANRDVQIGEDLNSTTLNDATSQRQHLAFNSRYVDSLDTSNFTQAAATLITSLDSTNRGYVTREQLARAVQDPAITGQQAQAAAALYRNFDMLSNLSGERSSILRGSVSLSDLSAFNQQRERHIQQVNESQSMEQWARNNLHRFDRSRNGYLSLSELNSGIQNAETNSEDRRMLETIRQNYNTLRPSRDHGVDLQRFHNYTTSLEQDESYNRRETLINFTLARVAAGQNDTMERRLYNNPDNPAASISPEAIGQGTIGNCYFEAALAGVARTNPELIQTAIRDNHNGTYTVTFPGAANEPITVRTPTEAEQGMYNRASEYGIWASVMEKAFGEYCQRHFWRRSRQNIGGGDTPTEGADGGGSPSAALRLLTGRPGRDESIYNSAQVDWELTRAFSGKHSQAVTAATRNGGETTPDGFFTGHAYTVTGISRDNQGARLVTVRNPWGMEDNTTSGTITVPLSTFVRNFRYLSFET